jgi:hypothetical protein
MAGPHVVPSDTADAPSMSPSNQSASDFSAWKQLLSTKQSDIKKLIEELQIIGTPDIQLPRIVACGDQSSGKSSVLEAISTLNFPRSESTCTRFATELSLCNKPGQDVANVSTSIRWDDPDNAPQSVHRPTTFDDLAKDIGDAYKAMESYNSSQNCSFFKHVLRIEASYSECPDITLIDLPGIVHSGKEKHDSEMVLDILKSYVREEKTIILAVVEANRDAEVQAVLDFAKQYDPEGKRTMGIITKPDRVEGSTSRDRWIEIASGNDPKYKFKYGWHVVRNRGPANENVSFQERDRQEKDFFSNSPWRRLSPTQLGVGALRTHLGEISEEHTRNALPVIFNELQHQLADCTAKLRALGPPRSTTQDYVHYLTNMSMKFNRLTYEAIGGLNDSPLYENEDYTFCSQLYKEYGSFGRTMHQRGHSFAIGDSGSDGRRGKIVFPTVDDLNDDHPQHFPRPESKTNQEFLNWIQEICGKRRGRELGLPDPLHINKVFRAQSKNWRMIAEAYSNSVWKITHDLLLKAAKSSVTNAEAHTVDVLVANLIEPEMAARKEKITRKLDEILRPYERHCAIPTDPDFQEAYEAEQRANREREIAEYVMESCKIAPGDDLYDQSMHNICIGLSTYEKKTPLSPSGPTSLMNLMLLYYKVRFLTCRQLKFLTVPGSFENIY